MNKYISILRGINVSGQKLIKMADLKELYESLNFKNVQTYIQSGNVIFCSELKNYDEIISLIETAIEKNYNFTVPVQLLTQQKLESIIEQNPFAQKGNCDITKLHVTILNKIPDKKLIENLESIEFGKDEFIIEKDVIYLHIPESYGNTKLNNNFFENKLKVKATTRNWKTTNKLFELIAKTIC
ncbi:MAG: DUF1697 domain-containing protein [Ignavibacteriae bacterium]|nr:DUF1697 domain-containing protein [Ignavibacteriota bacterium]MCB9207911.1 DUF1697 domain-containing protein [Ignavibacteriales bacterium]MCB9258681.1 DUF1697 domain-containing protein [Ignavibacteriales bacterium]